MLSAVAVHPATAQVVTVEATVSETKVFSGERISLRIEVSGDFNNVSRPDLPDFGGFRLLSNTPSTSRSFSFVNGETSTTYSYTSSLLASSTGSYTIPSISVVIDGTEYKTDPVAVEIIDRNATATDPTASQRPDIFLRLEVSDDTPFTGEQIIADVVLFFKSGLEVNSYQPVPGWKAEGFWKEELDNRERPRAESTILNGVRYRRARLLQFALFPTKAGELTISPYEIVISVRSSSSRNDPFGSLFGSFGSNQRRLELQTEPVSIEARSLPGISGANYIGAVGSYDISRSISTREAIVGETIEIETRISGTGNVPLISKPEYELPAGLEIYEPQENSVINRKDQRIGGTKTYTDIIIARTPGTFTLPETELAYFNPVQNRYVTETLPAIRFSVRPDPNRLTVSGQQQVFAIRPVTGLATWITPDDGPGSLLGYWWFWAGVAIPVIAVAVGYWQKTYREKMSTDYYFARSQKALDTADERLQSALSHSESGDLKRAYSTLHKALTGYIGDKMGLPEAGLSDQQYLSHLKEEEVSPELIRNVRMLLDKCSSISYAPETSHDYLKSHVGLAEKIIHQLKKEL
ncbi:MAG: BatD family protein [Balneolaceae bacterium]|nr:BatD family protein [Balneolaceae bacterium]